MPAPDESPRSSVANLIGRFEHQTKRLSQSAATASSRSSSVVSQTSSSGDAMKEEIKEKREWPPKSVSQQSDKPAFVLPSYLRPNVGALSNTVASSLAAASSAAAGGAGKGPMPAPAAEENGSKSSAEATSVPVPEPESSAPTPVPVIASASTSSGKSTKEAKSKVVPVDTKLTPAADDEGEPNTPKPGAIQKKPSTITVTPATARASAKTPTTAKPPTTATSKASHIMKSPAKPAATTGRATATPRQSLAPAPPAQPLKPQHTGQSVSSVSSTSRRLAPPSSKTPSTPSRARTPLNMPSRAKSPITPARCKTPSGLYAPTAASLARSRNAPPVPSPSGVRKVLSSDVAERLSKPTAASLSKARTPVATASPRTSGIGATPIKKSSTLGTPSRVTHKPLSKGTPIKKVSPAAATKVATTATEGAKAPAPVVQDIPREPENKEIIPVVVENGHQSPAPVESNQPEDQPIQEGHQVPNVTVDPEGSTNHEPERVREEEVVKVEAEPAEARASNTNGSNEIENIVNLLESAPATKLVSKEGNGAADGAIAVAADDVAGEIPDEE